MSTSTSDPMTNDRQQVFAYLMTCRAHVKFSNYATLGGIVNFDYVVVHEAPPRAVAEIVTQFRLVSLRPDGLYIPLTPDPK